MTVVTMNPTSEVMEVMAEPITAEKPRPSASCTGGVVDGSSFADGANSLMACFTIDVLTANITSTSVDATNKTRKIFLRVTRPTNIENTPD
jgi:hypothetical protein